MTTPYVCANCRSHVFLRTFGRLKFQWQLRATFISLRESEPAKSNDIPTLQGHDGKKPSQPRDGRLRKSYRPENKSRRGTRDDILEKLFASPAEADNKTSTPSPPLKVADELKENILASAQKEQHSWLGNLEQTIANAQTPLSVSWQLFRQYYGRKNSSGYTSPLAQDRVKLSKGTTFQALLKATVESWLQEQSPVGIPTPLDAVELFTSLGIMRDHFWADTIWSMLASTMNRGLRRGSQVTDEAQRMCLDHSTLADVLNVWKTFFATFVLRDGTGELSKQQPRDWSCLPGTELLKSVRGGFLKDFHLRFLQVLPNLPNSSASRSLALAMVSTFSTLYAPLRERELSGTIQSDALQFAHFVAHLLPYAELQLPKARSLLISLDLFPPGSVDSLLSQFGHTTEQAMAIIALAREADPSQGKGEDMLIERGSDSDRSMEGLFLKRLSRTIERTDLHQVERLWLEVQQFYKQASPGFSEEAPIGIAGSLLAEPASRFRIPSKLYHHFLMVFMALRRPQRAIDVWNDMVSSGQQPTPASWCAMIDGCGTARDTKSLESVWEKMCASGVKPDVGCWTSRIHGLISCGRWKQGIVALEDMGSKWKDAVKKSQKNKDIGDLNKFHFSATGDVNSVAKPNTVTVNAAISALLRQRKEDAARKVLRWAASFPINLDIYTFNTLLRTAFREGRTDEAQRLLRKMEAAAIKPDVVTFTMIINGIFRNTDLPLSAKELPNTISHILDEMEASGVAPNVYTYGTIIDGLLKQDSNLPAARAIFSHMAARRIKSSPHINTMLLTHHFVQNPPDLPEIESLWNRIKLEGGFVDVVFYDRMIEGYAKVGDVEKMMNFLLRMSREGMTPGWEALCSVLQALWKNDDHERLGEIIKDARDQDGLFKDRIRGLEGEGEFWNLVDAYESKGPMAIE